MKYQNRPLFVKGFSNLVQNLSRLPHFAFLWKCFAARPTKKAQHHVLMWHFNEIVHVRTQNCHVIVTWKIFPENFNWTCLYDGFSHENYIHVKRQMSRKNSRPGVYCKYTHTAGWTLALEAVQPSWSTPCLESKSLEWKLFRKKC